MDPSPACEHCVLLSNPLAGKPGQLPALIPPLTPRAAGTGSATRKQAQGPAACGRRARWRLRWPTSGGWQPAGLLVGGDTLQQPPLPHASCCAVVSAPLPAPAARCASSTWEGSNLQVRAGCACFQQQMRHHSMPPTHSANHAPHHPPRPNAPHAAGTLPAAYGSPQAFPKLTHFVAPGNQLTGSLPPSYSAAGAFPSLETMWVHPRLWVCACQARSWPRC